MIVRLGISAQRLLDRLAVLDFLPSLLLRLYLVPVFWMAGSRKAAHFDDTVEWFGNAEWGLGLPVPALMAFLATAAELAGAVSLALGLALRWMCIPLMATMLVAAVTVHWQNGWPASNNGIEFAVTYFVMLLALAFLGAGRYVSLDHWLRRRFTPSLRAA